MTHTERGREPACQHIAHFMTAGFQGRFKMLLSFVLEKVVRVSEDILQNECRLVRTYDVYQNMQTLVKS